PGRGGDAFFEVAIGDPALIPQVPATEFVARIDEERVALLLGQQIARPGFVESIRRAGGELVRRETGAVAGGQRIARRPDDDVAGRGERGACIGAAAGAAIAGRESAIGSFEPIALVVLERGE